MDMKLEVVFLAVSDVDRAKAFYENLGWRLDADFAPRRLPRHAIDAAQLRSFDHLRQGNHVGQAWLGATAWSSPWTTSTPPATT